MTTAGTEATSPGRANQKQRTRTAIVDAAQTLIQAGSEFTMPAVAREALVSEATAYRYFPDLVTLLREAFGRLRIDPVAAMTAAVSNDDPVERVGHAARSLLTQVASCQGAVRVLMSAAIVRPQGADVRPWFRLALIEDALAPLSDTWPDVNRPALQQLKQDLALVVSAEAFFTLVDLYGLSTDAAIDSAVHAAQALTAQALATRKRPGRTSR
jgi:AcrR family transcriptional regulator